MITMPLQGLDIPRAQRRPTKSSAGAAGREQIHAPRLVPTAEPAARLLQRPDPSILSEAIPLVLIGRNSDGFWVAREFDGRFGGIFLRKSSALRFAKNHGEPIGCATMLLAERLELDIENSGPAFVAQLGKVKQVLRRLTYRARVLLGKSVSLPRSFRGLSRALARQRMRRAAIGCYGPTSKSDDDLLIISHQRHIGGSSQHIANGG
jgi:hypothetical protein